MIAVQVIDPSLIPSDDDDKVDYGNSSIHTLCQQFPTLIDESTVLNEWNQLKFDNMAASPSTFLKSPWSFYQPYQTSYPELWKLIQLLLHVVLPINSASCERGFSKMKIIKSSKLIDETGFLLRMVSLAQDVKDDVIISKAVIMWHKQKRRHFSPSGSSGTSK